MPTKKNMRTRNSFLAKNMRPREKTCVPIRVIMRFRELCVYEKLLLSDLEACQPIFLCFSHPDYPANMNRLGCEIAKKFIAF